MGRNIVIRDILPEDMKYIWAAYVKGALNSFDPLFAQRGMSSGEFTDKFLEYVGMNYNGGWTIIAESREGFRPVGFIVAWVRPKVIEIGDMIWFPWATGRNIYESVVKYMDGLREEYTVFEFAHMKDKKFFERVADHGVMRKIGHVNGLYPDGPAVMFQTVRKK